MAARQKRSHQCEVVAKVGGSVVVRSWSSEVRHLGVPPAGPPPSGTLPTSRLDSGMLAGLHLDRDQHTAAHRPDPAHGPARFFTALELRRSSTFLKTKNM